jgi:hypothetical protein
MKHFLSDSGIWKVMAEFVDAEGREMHADGEVVNWVGKAEIITDLWVESEGIKRRNTYKVKNLTSSGNEMIAESLSADLPHLTGTYNIEHNILHFMYHVEGTGVNGYQITTRKHGTCYAYGAHYDGGKLLMTWTAMLNKKEVI